MEENKNEKPIYYTNGIGVYASLYDFKFDINYNSMEDNNNDVKYKLCEIVCSPEHAKSFANILNKTIEQYEKNFGKINTSNK